MNRFSIIIPAYNVGEYIEECIESIVKQEYNNYEIIVVNDSSTDLTGIKLAELKKKYLDINMKIIYNQQRLGVGKARNIGLDIAGGEYLLFVDADDYLCSKEALGSLHEKLSQNDDPDILMFGSVINYKDKKENIKKRIRMIPNKKQESKRYQLNRKAVSFIWPLCIKRNLIEKNHIRFQEDVKLYEDAIFRNQAIAYANDIKSDKCIYYNYNRRLDNGKSITTGTEITYKEKIKELKKVVDRINELVEKGEIPQEQAKYFKKTKLLFFKSSILITSTLLLKKIKSKIKSVEKQEEISR